MKLVSRDSEKLVVRMDSREYDALRAAVALRGHLPRKARPLTSDTAVPPVLRDAEKDLSEALRDHRRELTEGVDALLSDPVRCVVQTRGARILSLSPSDAELLLQTLNDLRLSAWERLGCPDFEAGDRPEVTDDNFLCLWALQVTDLFLAFLLTGLHGEP
ncbi:MAG: hypothetical protein JNL10_19645 [Verrucomicrobiales bacterium]|nr:hypothetical protein [Verrucomicrobiales bacterium]